MMESRVTRKCHARFGERDRETHWLRDLKVRSVPTLFSPLLANIALHGMEERIKQEFPILGKRNRETWYHKKGTRFGSPELIRYADDFVILHRDITVVQRCREIISEWLLDMNLELKPSKTRLTHTLIECEEEKPGFNFLGFNVRQFKVGKYHTGKSTNGELLGFKTIITPSKEKLKVHYERVATIIKDRKAAPQKALIRELNPVIRGWSNYYSTVVSKKAYSSQDALMYQKLEAWGKRRHPNKSKGWIAKKYWQTIGGKSWVFATRQEGKDPMRLRTHAETPIVRHVKVKGDASPYDGNLIYWCTRMGKHPKVPQRVAILLKRQDGKCRFCDSSFKTGDLMEVDHKEPLSKGGKNTYDNLQLLHRHCHDKKTAQDVFGTTRAKREIKPTTETPKPKNGKQGYA